MSILGIVGLPHFWMMITGIILLAISIVSVTLHKPKKWFEIHRIFAMVGIVLTIIGIFVLTRLIIALVHQIIGIVVLIWLIGEIIGGFVAYKKKDPKMRKLHVLTGRLAFITVIVVIILGIIGILAIPI
ncbi:MAG: hypothetical protein ACFFBP_18625 [Promethearchaeota archaeon]